MTPTDPRGPVAAPEPPGIALKVIIPNTGLPPVEAANWFHFATTGGEFQLLMGYLDLRKIADSIVAHQEAVEMEAEITHRIHMSLSAFQLLRRQIEQIAATLHLPKE